MAAAGLAVAAAFTSRATLAGDWTRFRGPDGSGVSDEKGLPVTWTADAKPLWKVALDGSGHGSPVVAGGTVYVVNSRDNGTVREVLAFSAADGSPVWRQQFPASALGTHLKGSPSAATPCLDADRIYVPVTSDGKLSIRALNRKDGSPAWSAEIGDFFSKHGCGASPVLAGGKLVVVNDTADSTDPDGNGKTGDSALTALDPATGKVLWRTPRTTGRAVFSTPTPAGDAVLVSSQAEGLAAYALADGKKLWGTPKTEFRSVGSPVVAGSVVTGLWGQGGAGRILLAVNPATGQKVWETAKQIPYVCTPLHHGGHIYVVADGGFVSCLAAADGAVKWTDRLGGKFAASPVLAGGNIYAVSEDGEVCVFAADPAKFRLAGRSPLGDACYATPAIADGKLFFRTHKGLVCIAGK